MRIGVCIVCVLEYSSLDLTFFHCKRFPLPYFECSFVVVAPAREHGG